MHDPAGRTCTTCNPQLWRRGIRPLSQVTQEKQI
jgi:hypothetical protein